MLIWMGLIFFLSHKPSDDLPKDFPNWIDQVLAIFQPHEDKVVHMGVYFFLGVFSYPSYIRHAFTTAGICFIYGLLDEIHQLYVPGRHFDLWDWAADCVGLCIAYVFFHLLLAKKFRATK